MKPKFKIGDIVKIKTPYDPNWRTQGPHFMHTMIKFCGNETKVENITYLYAECHYKLCGVPYNWDERWLEDLHFLNDEDLLI